MPVITLIDEKIGIKYNGDKAKLSTEEREIVKKRAWQRLCSGKPCGSCFNTLDENGNCSLCDSTANHKAEEKEADIFIHFGENALLTLAVLIFSVAMIALLLFVGKIFF